MENSRRASGNYTMIRALYQAKTEENKPRTSSVLGSGSPLKPAQSVYPALAKPEPGNGNENKMKVRA